MKMNNWNVIWLLVDSMRTYHSGLDDRDRLDLMDEMAVEAIEFERVVTSAPSSIMSVTAMMTGMPAYQVARDYDNFRFDPETFSSVPYLLKTHGYHLYGLVFFRDGRERFVNLFDQVDRRYWPRNLRHRAPYWTNDEMNTVLENLLEDGLREPFFLFVHYNIRKDPQTSEKVAHIVRRFKATGVYNRSIFILCSDHGYPDPRRGMGPQWFKDRGLNHDLIMTNDNLFIPLLMHYPSAKPRKISTTISSLDIAPTILDLLQIEMDDRLKRQMEGRSLVPLISRVVSPDVFESRYIRSDNRFFFQRGRATSLIQGHKKYVYHHDTGKEAFFDFATDRMEMHNLIDCSDRQGEIAAFREVYAAARAKARKNHLEYLLRKARQQAQSAQILPGCRLMLIDLSDWQDIDLVFEVLSEAFQPSDMALFADKEDDLASRPPNIKRVFSLGNLTEKTDELRQTLATYDRVVIIGNRLSYQDIRRRLGFLPGNILLLDSNMDPVVLPLKRLLNWRVLPRFLKARSRLYRLEPQMVIEDLRIVLRRLTGA